MQYNFSVLLHFSRRTPCRCPTLSRNPAMDTLSPTERLQNNAKASYFGSIKLAVHVFLLKASI